VPKTLQIFISERTNKQIETLDKHDINTELQKQLASFCKFANNAYDYNRVMFANQFTERILSFSEIDIPKHTLQSNPDWKPEEEDNSISKPCIFSHSIRDATYDNYVDFLNLNNAMNHHWVENIPDKAQMLQPDGSRVPLDIPKDKKKEMAKVQHPKCLEESTQRLLLATLATIVNEKVNAAITGEYEEPKVEKKK
jgi:hypothetical protein